MLTYSCSKSKQIHDKQGNAMFMQKDHIEHEF